MSQDRILIRINQAKEYSHSNFTFFDEDKITNSAAKTLAEYMQKPTCSLKELYVHTNNISQQGLSLLIQALEANTSLICLYFFNVYISKSNFQSLAQILKYNQSLEELQIHYSHANLNDITFILENNKSLKHMTLMGIPIEPASIFSHIKLPSNDIHAFATALKKNQRLKLFSMTLGSLEKIRKHIDNINVIDSGYFVNDKQISLNGQFVEPVIEAALANKNLTSFYFNNANISDQYAQNIADYIRRKDCHFSTLVFSGGRWSKRGIELIEAALPYNNSLTQLGLPRSTEYEEVLLRLKAYVHEHKKVFYLRFF